MMFHSVLPNPRRVPQLMALPALVTDWTIERLDAFPEDGQRYEIIDGMLHVDQQFASTCASGVFEIWN